MARIIFLEIVCSDKVRVIIVAYQRITNSGPVTTATIPYMRGTPETIAGILQPYNTRVTHKPITTLRRLLTNVKNEDKPEDRQGALYKIKCCDYQASYSW